MADTFFGFESSLNVSTIAWNQYKQVAILNAICEENCALNPIKIILRFRLQHDDHLLASDDVDCLETEEEEYDALNDETFGTIDDVSNDDWEQQHEQFAEFAESKKQSDKLGLLEPKKLNPQTSFISNSCRKHPNATGAR